MNPLLAKVLAIESPHNKVFLDYLMFNLENYLEDPTGSRTISLVLKMTQYTKFIEHCIQFVERVILEPTSSKQKHAADLMSQLIDLHLPGEKILNLIKFAFENTALVFTKSRVLFKPFVKLAILLPDEHLLALFDELRDQLADFVSCKSRNYLVQEFITRKTLPSFVVKYLQKLTLDNLDSLLP